MYAGEMVAERFEVRREAGAGGMSVIYQARDRLTGQLVALKVLEDASSAPVQRFNREIKLLAELRHPGIVGYVGNGTMSNGRRWLAMEWLEGEDLRERLARTGLTLAESVEVVRRAAQALAVAHRRGVVHRDIKPSNLFLVDGQIERVKLLDFGVAHLNEGAHEATRTGMRIGTPAYMSPEQARGLPDVDARVDVFALGCVLYQCVSGRRPFQADDPMALIAKILLAEPTRVSELRPEIPPEIDVLISRMLAKNADDRFADADAVAAALEALGPIAGGAPAGQGSASSAIGARERRLLCVVVMRGARPNDDLEDVRAKVGEYGGQLERLADGSLVTTLTGGVATDLAAQAGRCALAVRALRPELTLAVATGRGVVQSDRLPVGEAIDRAARLLRLAALDETTRSLDSQPDVRPRQRPVLGIRIDEVTAGLLDARFDVGGDQAGLELRAEREQVDGARTLLGRPTPCVSREAELGTLEAVYAAAAEEPEARAVLVTAPAGVGKSRIRYELLRRLQKRDVAPEILQGRADPISAGAPFALLAGAIRRAAGLLDGEPRNVRRRKLRARVGRHLPEADAQRVAEFIGELVGTPFPDDDSVQLRAARADARLMGDQMQRAFEDWLAAECDAQPVVLVLEDLHWGDLPTVTFVSSALRNLRDKPLMVIALARPEVHDLFPGLWADRGLQEIRLVELNRKASEKLVRQVLGKDADAQLVARLVERAAGNAFYLEELIRAAAENRGDELPGTVLAMVQARLEGMELEARRVLRAASVFGQVFWDGAVGVLLGGELGTQETSGWLETLIKREVVTVRGESKFRGQTEYVFRHAIVREAAYAMLTEKDRTLGHRLAADWLQSVGEAEPMVLAEHFERCGEPQRAVEWYRRAAEHARGGNDLAAVLARAERGATCGATGETLGALRLLQAEARNWRGEFAEAESAGLEAMRWLPEASEAWHAAVAELAFAGGVLGNHDRLESLRTALAQAASGPPSAAEVLALTRLGEQALYGGRIEAAEQLYQRFEAALDRFGGSPSTEARIYSAQASRALFEGNPGRFLELTRAAVASFQRAGDMRSVCQKQGSVGYACIEIGAFADGETALREVLEQAERMGLPNIAATAQQNLGLALMRLGKLDEACAVEGQAMEAFRVSGNRRMEAASRYYLALALLVAGDLPRAEEEAKAAVAQAELAPMLPPIVAEGSAILGQILLARGRGDEALAAAQTAMRLLEEMGGIDGGESTIRLVYAEALAACGREDQAKAAFADARARLLVAAAKISDPEVRRRFLELVPDNDRTMRLSAI
jgi:tetratricopeptide (TPR) repeat protein